MANFPQLTEEEYNQFNHFLGDLLAKTEASVVLIVEKAGHLIHECGQAGQFETTLVATLASNAYNATAFMANLINEPEFTGMYQQGVNFSTLILNIDEHCLLIIIFKADLSVGAMKYYAADTITQIAQQIEIAQKRAPTVSFDLTDLNVEDASALFLRREPTEEAPEAVEAPLPAPPPEQAYAEFQPEPEPEPDAEIPPPPQAPEPDYPPVAAKSEPYGTAALPAAFMFAPDPTPPTSFSRSIEPAEPIVCKRGPFIEAVDPGTYYWCSCGRSKHQPFCDGSHAGTGLEPLQVEIAQSQKRAFCGCKHTKHPPFCDGNHNKIKA